MLGQARRTRPVFEPEVVTDVVLPPRRRGDDPRTLRDLDGIVHVLTCGSVDDGKSSLIGRLLWDAGEVADDQRASLLRSATAAGEPDLSLLVDGLLAEREQGITIDIAWRYIDAGSRRVVIIDSPGHEQYTRNMASGASHADVAVMLVDARHGIKTQTRRHAAILDLVGVRRVVLAVNKMDLVGWSAQRFHEIEADFTRLSGKFGFHDARAIPLSAKLGDNVVRRSKHMAWYAGPTLLQHLDGVPSRGAASALPFRFPVQMVLRSPDFRGLAGSISAGCIAVGDVVRDAASGLQARVSRILTMDGDLPAATSGRAVVLQLDRDLDIARGAVLAAGASEPKLARGLEARLIWLSDAPLAPDQRLLLRTPTDLVPVERLTVKARLDLATLAQQATTTCAPNDIVAADIELGRPAVVDRFADVPETGGFVLVDVLTGATVAGGVVRAVREHRPGARRAEFRLTRGLLERGVCAGLSAEDPEFARRAEEVRRLMETAGIHARIDLDVA
ncbi:MAG: sulfate adenylyltransferase [Hyphomicrobiaceae bacterium]|nr:MAG: sulfate adenylyltransferase [Hyphomicrobiaceae bacterium]